jgi:hypothetical protein
LNSMPFWALITSTAVSTAASDASACPMKSGSPGVSMRFTSRPSWVANSSVALVEWWRARASGSKSLVVLSVSTEPSRLMAPHLCRMASLSDVLPEPACPKRAMFRMSCGRNPLGACMPPPLYALPLDAVPRPGNPGPVDDSWERARREWGRR